MTPQTPTGHEPSPLPAAPAVRRRRPWLLAVVVLTAVVLAVAGAGAWRRWGQPPAPAPEPPMPADIKDDEVRQVIERARQKVLDEPRSADAWGVLGMTLLTHLFHREADRCFVEAARLDPTDPRWPYARGRLARKLAADPERAFALLRQALALSDSRPNYQIVIRLQLAEALLEHGQLDQARQLFQEEWDHHPGNPRAALGLGQIALARGDYATAEHFLTVARGSNYALKTATAHLAAVARARADEALAKAHGADAARYEEEAANYEKKAASYEKEVARLGGDPEWPDPFVEAIVALRVGRRWREYQEHDLEKKNRHAEAAQMYLDDLKKHPSSRAAVGAGANFIQLKDYERAMPLLRQGVELDPHSAHAHYMLGLVLFSRAERERRQSPDSAQATEWFRAAIPSAQRATELKADYGQAYMVWGLALKALGQPADAVVPLRKGVACRPDDLELQLGLGEALLESGQLQEAEIHLENARKLNSDPKDQRPEKALERLRRKKG